MKVLFGSIIVQGAGKINGHCLRNFRKTAILGKLPSPNKSSLFLSNPQKKITIESFKFYSKQDEAIRRTWRENSLLIQFPDRFGNMRYLSAPNFCSKIYLNSTLSGQAIVKAIEFDATKPSIYFDFITIDATNQKFLVNNLTSDITDSYILYLMLNKSKIQEYSARQLKIVLGGEIGNLTDLQLYELLLSKGFNFQKNQKYTIGIRSISTSGIPSPMKIIETIVV